MKTEKKKKKKKKKNLLARYTLIFLKEKGQRLFLFLCMEATSREDPLQQ
jgi:hypothetical protein